MTALRNVVYVGHILIGARRNHELLTDWLDAADNPGSRATVPVRRGPECFLAPGRELRHGYVTIAMRSPHDPVHMVH